MNFVNILVDEVALEGLDGITLPSLWLRLEERNDFTLALEEASKAFLWHSLVSKNGMKFYKLPAPRSDVEKFDRFEHICEVDGTFSEPENIPPELYPVEIVDSDTVLGSCSTFKTRTDITDSIKGENGMCLCSYQEAMERWGRSLVVVASQSQRFMALTGSPVKPKWLKSPVYYAILERLGRARYNGLTKAGPPQLSVTAFPPRIADAKYFFNVVKGWVKLNVASKQILAMKHHSGTPSQTNLVQLKRFYRPIVCRIKEIGDQLCDYLLTQPDKRQLLSIVYDALGLDKKLMRKVRPYVKDRIVFETVPYREMFPDATEKEWQHKSRVKERICRTIRLVQGVKEEEEEEDLDDNSDDDEGIGTSGATQIGDTEHHTWKYGESFLRQVYQQIHAAGNAGITQKVLASRMGAEKQNCRQGLKILRRAGFIAEHKRDRDQQRIRVFVALPFAHADDYHRELEMSKLEFEQKTTESIAPMAVNAETDRENQATNASTLQLATSCHQSPVKKLQDDMAPPVPPSPGTSVAEASQDTEVEDKMSDIKATFITQDIKNVSLLDEATLKVIQRANILMDIVKEQRIIDTINNLRQSMLKRLNESGEQLSLTTLCSKTLQRLVDMCHAQHKVQKFIVRLESREKSHDLILICANDVSQEDPAVTSIIQQAKMRHFHGCLPKTENTSEISKKLEKMMMPQSVSESILEWDHLAKPMLMDDMPEATRRQGTLYKYGTLPKMQRSVLLHKFLWYLIYGYQCTTPSERSQCSDADSKEAAAEDGEAAPPVFLDTRDWRRYLAPLRQHEDALPLAGRIEGTCLIGDLFLVMPLSIFVQCFSITWEVDRLERYVFDLDKQFYPITHLPLPMLHQILRKRNYLSRFQEECNRLAMMGLLTFGPLQFIDRSKMFLYLHKKGMLLDTRSCIPGIGHAQPPEGQNSFPEMTFTFNTMEDVENYWSTMQVIALNTQIRRQAGQSGDQNLASVKVSLADSVKNRSLADVSNDFILPGDRRGAAGLDSSFCIQMPRNWVNVTKLKKPKAAKRRSSEEDADGENRSVDNSAGRAKGKKKMKTSGTGRKQPEQTPGKEQGTDVQREFTTVTVTGYHGNRGGRGIKRPHRRRFKVKHVKPKRPRRHGAPQRKRQIDYADDVDKEAMKRMVKQRAGWSTQEMNVLLICRVAAQVLLPDYQALPINYSVVRDILHEKLPELALDKTHMACRRKIMTSMRKEKTANSVQQYVARVRQDKELMSQFKDAIRSMGSSKASRGLPKSFYQRYREFVGVLLEKFSMIEGHGEFVEMPATLDALNRDFDMWSLHKTESKQLWRDLASDFDAFGVALRDFQMSHILCDDRQNRTFEMYWTLRQYPDSIVRGVFEKLQTDKMIAKRKIFRKQYDNLIQHQTSALITRYMTSQRYQMALRHASKKLFRASSTLIVDLLSHQGQSHDQIARSQGEGHPQCSEETDGFYPVTGDIEAGHVALVIALTALNKLSLQIELPTEIFSLPKDVAEVEGERRRPDGDDDDEGEEEHDGTSDDCQSTAEDSLSSPAKRSRQDDVEQVGRAGFSAGSSSVASRKRKRELSEESSDEDPQSEDEYPASKKPRPSTEDSEPTDTQKRLFSLELFVSEKLQDARMVEEKDGFLKMRQNITKVRFQRTSVPQGVDGTHPPSHKAVSLTRMAQSWRSSLCSSSRSHDRFLLNTCKLEVALKDGASSAEASSEETVAVSAEASPEKSAALSVEGQSGNSVAVPKGSSPENTLAMSVEVPSENIAAMSAEPSPENSLVASEAQSLVPKSSTSTSGGGRSEFQIDCSVMEGILCRQQKLLPQSMDMEVVWVELGKRLEKDDLAMCKKLYDVIDSGRTLGRTWNELKMTAPDANMLQRCLDRLMETDAVLRVGVAVFRYVSLARARFWVTYTLKNNRGRGNTFQTADQDITVSVENVPQISTAPPEHSPTNAPAPSVESETADDSALPGQESARLVHADRNKGGKAENKSDSGNTADLPCVEAPGPSDPTGAQDGDKCQMDETADSPPRRERPGKKMNEGFETACVQPTSTYENVRLLSRIWRKPEGGMNRVVLIEYLDSVLQYAMFHPGCSVSALVQRFHPIFTPVSLMEIMEILEELGCVKKFAVPKSRPATLFSKRRVQEDVTSPDVNSAGSDELLYDVTVDCAMRLGQFLNYMG